MFICVSISINWIACHTVMVKARIIADKTNIHVKKFLSPIPITLSLNQSNVYVYDIITDLWNQSKYKRYINDNLFEFAYRNNPSSPNHEFEYITLQHAITMYQVNKTVLLMLTDNGYINQFMNTYISSNLEKYPNLIVVCLNDEAYKVNYYCILFIRF